MTRTLLSRGLLLRYKLNTVVKWCFLVSAPPVLVDLICIDWVISASGQQMMHSSSVFSSLADWY